MATALDVARLLISLAGKDGSEEYDPLTPMRLQKLLYYTQGWALATLRRPLFPEKIEAWAHGPVVKEVYQVFKPVRRGVIPDNEGASDAIRSPSDRSFVEAVWMRYRDFTASKLRRMTHCERPYLTARGGIPEDVRSDAEITQMSMREFFAEECRPLLIPGIDPADAYQSLAEMEQGQRRSHSEVFAHLRGRS